MLKLLTEIHHIENMKDFEINSEAYESDDSG